MMHIEQGRELKEFNRLYRELDKIYHNISLHAGLSDSACMILYAIVELGDGCLQKDIADLNSISRKTINSSIKNLEKQGYIILKQGKGRDMHIYLTDCGQKLAANKIAPLFEAENKSFTAMTPEDSRELLRLTHKYVDIFRNMSSHLIE